MAWQGYSSSIYIKMSPEFVGRTCGMCGNFNADVQDDLKTSYGKNFCCSQYYMNYPNLMQMQLGLSALYVYCYLNAFYVWSLRSLKTLGKKGKKKNEMI